MSLIVQKYGGSSVENKEKLEIVCNNILSEKENNNDLVVVVSAQGKTTNHLIEKAEEYTAKSSTLEKKDLDFLLSTGEMQTAALLSLMLNSKGYKAVALTGAQAGIITNSEFGNAKIIDIVSSNILSYLKDNYIVIVTGFQGIDTLGNITTLGRGGSDLSAVALAAALDAARCEIFSDIDGIYTSDPKLIPNSKILDSVSFDEMLEASSAGAKVLHNRSVNLAKKYNLKILAKGTFTKSNGSEVQNNIKEDFDVHFITKKDDLTKICIVGPMMLSNRDAISQIFKIADEENIEIYIISFSELTINLVVDTKKSQYFMEKLHEILVKKN
ncbi:MAG: aspartate kinase [Clostridia bacterium]|nr:aspartate kinase [Clostridia bacterium]